MARLGGCMHSQDDIQPAFLQSCDQRMHWCMHWQVAVAVLRPSAAAAGMLSLLRLAPAATWLHVSYCACSCHQSLNARGWSRTSDSPRPSKQAGLPLEVCANPPAYLSSSDGEKAAGRRTCSTAADSGGRGAATIA